jgi:RNA polymerase sigma-70 factor (family 1)
MSDFLPDNGGKGSVMRPQGTEARIIDSEVLLKGAFEEDPRGGCAMLFRLYYTQLFSHAIRFVYSKPVAEDIVAEVFHKFWEDKIFLRINTSYRAYLFKSVRHRAYNYVKFELARKSRNENLECAQESSTPGDILQYDELYRLLEGTINKLPQQCKKVFVLSRMENKKYQDIADELGVSVKAIEGHISRALRVLRKQLAHNYDWL